MTDTRTGTLLTLTLGAIVILTQATDALSTVTALSMGGHEANPLMDRLIVAAGPSGFIGAKVAAGTVIAVAFRRRLELLAVLGVWFAGVTLWNILQIGRLAALT